MLNEHVNAVTAALTEPGTTVKLAPLDVLALCERCPEDATVTRVRQAASLPHPAEAPIELERADVQHVLAGVAGTAERQHAQSPAGIVERLEASPDPMPWPAGKAEAAPEPKRKR